MQTMFYFNDVSQLADFEAFKVKPVAVSHAETVQPGETPKAWSVIGILKVEKAQEFQLRQLPVADLPSELYAGLFASICKQVTGKV